jgi:hypothetical protein
MSDTNDKIRAELLDLLTDPRCLAIGLAVGIVGYVLGRLGL